MFLLGWALKDISITVKVKIGQIDNMYSREFFVQIIPHCTKSYPITDPKGTFLSRAAQKPYFLEWHISSTLLNISLGVFF